MLSHIWNALIVVLVLGAVFYAGMSYEAYHHTHKSLINVELHK